MAELQPASASGFSLSPASPSTLVLLRILVSQRSLRQDPGCYGTAAMTVLLDGQCFILLALSLPKMPLRANPKFEVLPFRVTISWGQGESPAPFLPAEAEITLAVTQRTLFSLKIFNGNFVTKKSDDRQGPSSPGCSHRLGGGEASNPSAKPAPGVQLHGMLQGTAGLWGRGPCLGSCNPRNPQTSLDWPLRVPWAARAPVGGTVNFYVV